MMIKKTGMLALLLSFMMPSLGMSNDALTSMVAYDKKIELVYPQQSAIAQHKESLQRTASRTRLLRYGIYGASAIVTLAATYNLLKWCGFIGTQSPVSAGISADALLLKTPDDLKKFDERLYPSFFSWRGLHHLRSHMTNYIVAGFSSMVGSSIAQGTIAHIGTIAFPEGSIEWLVKEKTTLMSTFDECKEYVDALSDIQVSAFNKAMYRNLMTASANNLVAQLEWVMGFMAYKKGTCVDQKAVDEVVLLLDYIFDTTHVFCVKMNTCLQDNDLKVDQLAVTLVSFKREIHRLMKSFSRIEKAPEL